MKTYRMVTLGLMSLFSAVAQADVRIGNGGDSLAAQFVETADDLVQLVETAVSERNMTLPTGLNLDALRYRVRTAKVFSSEKTMLGAYEVDALNYPVENKIVFGRNRFAKLVLNLKAQRTLVVHEYMGLAGIDDSSYQFSNFLIRKVMNGGDKGELWLLKDLMLPGFQNPFRAPVLELSTNLFLGYSGTKQRNFQGGAVVGSVAANRPYCVVSTNPIQNTNDPSVRFIRVGISAADATDSSGLGTEVTLRMQRPTITPLVRCSSGSDWRRVTLQDMLDAFGSQINFAHEGTSPLGNEICRQSE